MQYIYFDFFSVGAIILVAFTLTVAVLFLSIPNKSKATFHLGRPSFAGYKQTNVQPDKTGHFLLISYFCSLTQQGKA